MRISDWSSDVCSSDLASVLSFFFRDEVLPYYGGGCRAARVHAANDFMYWAVMRRACESGRRVFDFGRSKVGTGSYAFKMHWGFEPTPLFYENRLLRPADVPANNPLNPKSIGRASCRERMCTDVRHSGGG